MAKAPKETGLFEDEETVKPKIEMLEDGWLQLPAPPVADFGPYPYDGAPVVLLSSDGLTSAEAVWRKSRSFNAKSARWDHSAFWCRRNTGGAPIGFTATDYKKFVEPPLVAPRHKEPRR